MGARPENGDLFTKYRKFENLPSADLLELARERTNLNRLFHVKHKPGTHRGRILRYFLHVDHRGKWHNSGTLGSLFMAKRGHYFVGINYGKRMRELAADGVLLSERDPGRHNRTHRWRLNPDLLDILAEIWESK
jgi:hypothetical protein